MLSILSILSGSSSTSRFKTFLYRDALIVAFTNCATSVFAAIIIFAIMGFKASLEIWCDESDWQTFTKNGVVTKSSFLQAHNAYEACLRVNEMSGNLTDLTQTSCDLQVR